MNKVITCVSFGGTGSSAITDLLKEFDNIESKGDFEFTFLYEPDGVSDLEHYIVRDFQRLKTDEGIFRFENLCKRLMKEGYSNYIDKNNFQKSVENYIDDLTDVSWNGYWHAHKNREKGIFKLLNSKYDNLKLRVYRNMLSKLDEKYKEYTPNFKKSEMRLSNLTQEEFIEYTQDFTEKFINLFENNKEFIALDQLLPSYNLENYMKYFKKIKVIVVDRDPRDLYILNKYFWNEGWIPSQSIDLYIKWFKLIRKDQYKSENILRINFEELIFDYENSLDKIITFLDIDKTNHTLRKKYFNPEISIKNTRLWNKYLDKESENLKKIECELSKYCYMEN